MKKKVKISKKNNAANGVDDDWFDEKSKMLKCSVNTSAPDAFDQFYRSLICGRHQTSLLLITWSIPTTATSATIQQRTNKKKKSQ